MDRFRRYILLLTVVLLVFLIYTSILSAFYGSGKASLFFNSFGMSMFWLVLLAILLVSFVAFKLLRRSPGLMLIHLACILILAGSIYGSRSSHYLRQRFFGERRIYDGYLLLHEDASDNRLISQDQSEVLGELPFHLALERFSIEYYPAARLSDAQVKQCTSTVLFVSPEGKKLGGKKISVNHPASYGGYYFYQSSYGSDYHGKYTILHAKTASGLFVVYTGYAFLCLGVIWSLWGRNLLPAIRSYKGVNSDGD
jgi:energy-coupling factor transporter transmembrane protein EcfT